MYAVSDKYKSTLTEKTKTDRVEIKITTKDGSVINIADDKLIKGSLSIDNKCLNGSEFQFGCAYAGECSFSFKDDVDRYSLFDGTVEVFYYRIFADGTEEQIPMGVYLIDEAEKSYSITSIKALDRMTLLDVALTKQTVGTVFELLTYLSTECGFELAQTQAEIESLANGTEMFSFYPERIESMRDCLSYLSAVTATFAIFDRFGKLKLCEFQTIENWEISNDFRIKSKFNDAETFYKGVTVRFLANQNFYPYSKIEDERGDGLILDMGDIPIVQGTPETKDLILTNIYNCLVNIKYRPCEVDYFGNPAIDLGDCIKFTEGNSIVTGCTWKYRGSQSLKSIGLNPKLQAVKDKTYKQLVSMSADVEACKIGVYEYINSQGYVITTEPVKVITMQYSSVADGKTLFFASIQVDLDKDGEIEITYYIDQLLDEERTRRVYLSKGKHLLTLFDWVETKENARNELWVFLQPLYVESVERVQTADIDTQKNRISALIDSVTNQTVYTEPTPTEVDTTSPTITVLEKQAKALVYGQGLATSGFVWDGTLNFDEPIPIYTFDNMVSDMTLEREILENITVNTQIPIPSGFTEIIPTMTYAQPDDMTIAIVSETLSVGSRQLSTTITVDTPFEGDEWFVDKTENKFRPQTSYEYIRTETVSDMGLRAEINVNTGGINVTALEVVDGGV